MCTECQNIPHIGSIACILHCIEENHGHCSNVGFAMDIESQTDGCDKSIILGSEYCEKHYD